MSIRYGHYKQYLQPKISIEFLTFYYQVHILYQGMKCSEMNHIIWRLAKNCVYACYLTDFAILKYSPPFPLSRFFHVRVRTKVRINFIQVINNLTNKVFCFIVCDPLIPLVVLLVKVERI